VAHVDLAYLKTLADMSHLRFSDKELEHLASDIESVLSYVECLGQSSYALDVDVVQYQGECNRTREDIPVVFDASKILNIAPDVDCTYFVVPSIINQESSSDGSTK